MMSDTKFSLRRHTGRILYHKGDTIAGCEDFGIDVRESGRTIRAYCEMGEGGLTRDASWTLDGKYKPVEGYVRVVQNGIQTGSAWYRFTENEVECEALTTTLGRTAQRLPSRARYLGLHPLVGDGMIALARGKEEPGREDIIESVTCSYDINGETSLVALPIDIAVTYVGVEEVTVPAGTFTTDRYALRWQPHWPAADLWVHGEDAVFVRLDWEFSGLSSQLERYECMDDPLTLPSR